MIRTVAIVMYRHESTDYPAQSLPTSASLSCVRACYEEKRRKLGCSVLALVLTVLRKSSQYELFATSSVNICLDSSTAKVS